MRTKLGPADWDVKLCRLIGATTHWLPGQYSLVAGLRKRRLAVVVNVSRCKPVLEDAFLSISMRQTAPKYASAAGEVDNGDTSEPKVFKRRKCGALINLHWNVNLRPTH